MPYPSDAELLRVDEIYKKTLHAYTQRGVEAVLRHRAQELRWEVEHMWLTKSLNNYVPIRELWKYGEAELLKLHQVNVHDIYDAKVALLKKDLMSWTRLPVLPIPRFKSKDELEKYLKKYGAMGTRIHAWAIAKAAERHYDKAESHYPQNKVDYDAASKLRHEQAIAIMRSDRIRIDQAYSALDKYVAQLKEDEKRRLALMAKIDSLSPAMCQPPQLPVPPENLFDEERLQERFPAPTSFRGFKAEWSNLEEIGYHRVRAEVYPDGHRNCFVPGYGENSVHAEILRRAKTTTEWWKNQKIYQNYVTRLEYEHEIGVYFEKLINAVPDSSQLSQPLSYFVDAEKYLLWELLGIMQVFNDRSTDWYYSEDHHETFEYFALLRIYVIHLVQAIAACEEVLSGARQQKQMPSEHQQQLHSKIVSIRQQADKNKTDIQEWCKTHWGFADSIPVNMFALHQVQPSSGTSVETRIGFGLGALLGCFLTPVLGPAAFVVSGALCVASIASTVICDAQPAQSEQKLQDFWSGFKVGAAVGLGSVQATKSVLSAVQPTMPQHIEAPRFESASSKPLPAPTVVSAKPVPFAPSPLRSSISQQKLRRSPTGACKAPNLLPIVPRFDEISSKPSVEFMKSRLQKKSPDAHDQLAVISRAMPDSMMETIRARSACTTPAALHSEAVLDTLPRFVSAHVTIQPVTNAHEQLRANAEIPYADLRGERHFAGHMETISDRDLFKIIDIPLLSTGKLLNMVHQPLLGDLSLRLEGSKDIIKLPAQMAKNIIAWLNDNPEREHWACINFVRAAFGMERGDFDHPRFWSHLPCTTENLQVGDAVVMTEPGGVSGHIGIYLGNDQYLAKNGEGPLVVGQLSVEKDRFQQVFIARPGRKLPSELTNAYQPKRPSIQRTEKQIESPSRRTAVTGLPNSSADVEEHYRDRGIDIMLNSKLLPSPVKEIATELNNARKAAKLIKKHGFWSGSLAAAGIRVGATVGSRLGPLGKMAGAEIGRRVLQPVGEVLDEATRRQAEIETKMIEAGVAPIPFGHH